ncbi:hypothetical protein PCANC_14425 [Puccinia coronata f. sp. avenae]|uniref:Uncharacterized protein n=1 Tax=Puccinia coronata f. sp. avenae TaxID=200324 RepID=A0A2N5SHH6_9BASI|nr:hypothetical protein PCANC_14425 [Puccinia coronata f. sp. avenae]
MARNLLKKTKALAKTRKARPAGKAGKELPTAPTPAHPPGRRLRLRLGAPPIPFSRTAGINRSNTAVRAVLEQPCSTGGRTDTVRPKREPTGRTDLSDRSRLVLCNRSQELIGQACPTRRQVLRSDSACPTTGRTRLFEHRSNCRVRPVNAGSVGNIFYFLFPFAHSVSGPSLPEEPRFNSYSADPNFGFPLLKRVISRPTI